MTLPVSGEISLADIAGEFGGSVPHSMSEYYRDGGLVPGNNTSVPTSGTIDMADFYGTTALAITWNTASGNLGTVWDQGRSSTTFTVSASATSGGVSYSIVSGSGASINSSTGAIGSFSAVGSDTTTTYSVRATSTVSGSVFADRNFSITRNAPRVSYYNYTGGDQTFTVPTGVTRVLFKLWGGGGGGNSGKGGGAGYSTGIRNVSGGQSYTLRVAGKGIDTCSGECSGNISNGGYGGGGRGREGGGGGGGSFVFYGGTAHGNCVAAAGGGGGEGASTAHQGGYGGGTSGGAGAGGSGGGRGGTQTAGGAPYACDGGCGNVGYSGGPLYGGYMVGQCGAGGGSGYYGGATGCRQGGWVHKAGGGGSGYTGGLNSSQSMTAGSGSIAGNRTDSDNGSSYGSVNQHGRIVVRY
jgi:hypothetical protein